MGTLWLCLFVCFYIIGNNILNSFVFVMVVMWKYSWQAHCERIQASQAWRFTGGRFKGQHHKNQKQTVRFKSNIDACPFVQRYAHRTVGGETETGLRSNHPSPFWVPLDFSTKSHNSNRKCLCLTNRREWRLLQLRAKITLQQQRKPFVSFCFFQSIQLLFQLHTSQYH